MLFFFCYSRLGTSGLHNVSKTWQAQMHNKKHTFFSMGCIWGIWDRLIDWAAYVRCSLLFSLIYLSQQTCLDLVCMSSNYSLITPEKWLLDYHKEVALACCYGNDTKTASVSMHFLVNSLHPVLSNLIGCLQYLSISCMIFSLKEQSLLSNT